MEKREINQTKLDNCKKPHDFQPVFEDDGETVRFYSCSKCGGKVGALEGLRYELTGDLGE